MYFLQQQGIPQGSTLSTLLCCLYLAELERVELLPRIRRAAKGDDFLLMRQTDDFFFVSTEKNAAMEFLETMQKGFPSFNCFVNPEKSKSTFERGEDHLSSQFINWSGLSFDSRTLDVSCDHASFAKTLTEFSTSFVASSESQLRKFMQHKAYRLLLPRTHPLLLDLCINSKLTVARNVHDLFL